MSIRLNKFLAESGLCSRRDADLLISAGKISVNDQIVRELGTKINEDSDIVLANGKSVTVSNKFVYYALYKPVGVISTSSDDHSRQAVVDLVPSSPRVYPVGRLDSDSEGLIILTNDGELTQKLTHPSFKHEKVYEVSVSISSDLKNQPNLEKYITAAFLKGFKIDGNIMSADKVQVPKIENSTAKLQITLHTGYNRQIRKMCGKIGLGVTRLVRKRIGKLNLSDLKLKSGEYRQIKKDQII